MSVSALVTGIEEVVVDLLGIADAIKRDIYQVVARWTVKLESIVKLDKLSGGVLNVRTGRLRNSIHSKSEQTADGAIGRVYANMAEAAYARFWEFGFTGIEHIRSHLRTQTMAWGRPIEPVVVTVAAHFRDVDQPARSYLRSTLGENETAIRTDVNVAAIGAAGGGA